MKGGTCLDLKITPMQQLQQIEQAAKQTNQMVPFALLCLVPRRAGTSGYPFYHDGGDNPAG